MLSSTNLLTFADKELSAERRAWLDRAREYTSQHSTASAGISTWLRVQRKRSVHSGTHVANKHLVQHVDAGERERHGDECVVDWRRCPSLSRISRRKRKALCAGKIWCAQLHPGCCNKHVVQHVGRGACERERLEHECAVDGLRNARAVEQKEQAEA